jgi:hypothetical protein
LFFLISGSYIKNSKDSKSVQVCLLVLVAVELLVFFNKKGSIPTRVHAATCALHDKHITIVNDDSSPINKFGASLSDNTRIIICGRNVFIVQATGERKWQLGYRKDSPLIF